MSGKPKKQPTAPARLVGLAPPRPIIPVRIRGPQACESPWIGAVTLLSPPDCVLMPSQCPA